MSAIASVTEVELSKDLQVRSRLHVLLQHPEGMQYMPCLAFSKGCRQPVWCALLITLSSLCLSCNSMSFS